MVVKKRELISLSLRSPLPRLLPEVASYSPTLATVKPFKGVFGRAGSFAGMVLGSIPRVPDHPDILVIAASPVRSSCP